MTFPKVDHSRRRGLLRDDSGVAIVEMAIVTPMLLLLLIGAIELGIAIFVGSSIESAVLAASRYGITGSAKDGLSRDKRVLKIIGEKTYGLVDMDKVELDTLVYDHFSDIGKPEPFVDENDNEIYDVGEPYTDVNGNAQWDPDMGAAGLGGPEDIVLYRVTYQWGIITPLIRAVLGQGIRYVSTVAVKNEDF